MKKSSRGLVASFALSAAAFAFPAHAQTQTTTQRLYLFQPGTIADVSRAAEAAEAALASRGRVAKRVGLLPGTLPDRPGEPTIRSTNYGPTILREINCDDAYALISLGSSTGNMLGSSGERFSACVYPSKAGTRIALVIERSVSGGIVGGAIVGFIRNAIQGDEKDGAKKLQDEMLMQVRKTLPVVLVELSELPGGLRSTPDADKVAQLLPPEMPSPARPTATNPSDGSSGNAIIDARKQLVAMGLTYHSVDAFQDAIRRKDNLAVELFIAAASVSSSVRGSGGQTAIEVAESTLDQYLIKIVRANPR